MSQSVAKNSARENASRENEQHGDSFSKKRGTPCHRVSDALEGNMVVPRGVVGKVLIETGCPAGLEKTDPTIKTVHAMVIVDHADNTGDKQQQGSACADGKYGRLKACTNFQESEDN